MEDMPSRPWNATPYEERIGRLGHRHDRELVMAALGVLGDNDAGDLDPEDLTWRYVPDLPVGTLLKCLGGNDGDERSDALRWRRWFADELTIDRDEFDGGRGWASLSKERVREPVIVTVEPGRTQIWDGWHRVGGTISSGRPTIPAIVGRPMLPEAGPS